MRAAWVVSLVVTLVACSQEDTKTMGDGSAGDGSGTIDLVGHSVDLKGDGGPLDDAANPLDDGGTSDAAGTPPDLAPIPLITPDDPGAADYTTTIDTSQARHAISHLIYGYNLYNTNGSTPPHLTFDRFGGDRMCSYNWEKNVESSGGQNNSDPYFYTNDYNYYGGVTSTIGGDMFAAIDANRARDAVTMPVIPMMDYVAADAAGKIDIFAKDTYLSHFIANQLDSGFLPTTSAPAAPNLSDSVVKQDEFANYLRWHYPTVTDLFTHPTKRVIFGLDNEPELWLEAFPILQRGDTEYPIDFSQLGPESAWQPPTGDTTIGFKVTPDAFIQRTKTITKALRRVVPAAEIIGPSHFGYDAMVNFNDYTWTQYSDTGTWFMDDYLQQLKDASTTAGVRLLDAFDFHWYPAARLVLSPSSKRVIDITSPASDAEFDLVVQAPRSYWDPTYVELSYITQDHTNGAAINLLARIQARIDAVWPGTKLGITEYYPGAGGHIAGGIAEADTLGIFGRFGLYVAALWPYSFNDATLKFVHGGMKMYRGYDGALGMFGDTSVSTTFSQPTAGSAYASVDASTDDRIVLVVINKQKTAKTNAIRFTHTKQLGTAEVYLLSGSNANPVKQADIPLTKTNALVYTMPARSVTTLVFKP